MSLPIKGGTTVHVTLEASEAARLAEEINYYLSRAQDLQEADATVFTMVDRSKPSEAWAIRSSLNRIRICEGVTMTIAPDQTAPETSAYVNYSGPSPRQYIASLKGE